MSDAKSAYWVECIETSFEENGIQASRAQIEAVARDVEVSNECIGMAFPTPESPLISEVSTLKRELNNERRKVQCRECNGRGTITIPGPYHSSTSQCTKCRGDGRHDP